MEMEPKNVQQTVSSITNGDVVESDIDGIVQEDDRELLVLYASQTGSAQDVAEFIGREAWRRHFKARVQDVKDFNKAELLNAPPTIIITSTTGQGAFPTAMLPLWNFLLRTDLPPELLETLDYALFGLGDSTYPKFNWPVRKLKRRLDMLGASEIIEKGEADDQHYLGIDGTLLPWLDKLWSTLLLHFPLPSSAYIRANTARPPPRISLTRKDDQTLAHRQSSLHFDHMHVSVLIQNTRVTAKDHFQDTRHIILQFAEDVFYEAGDVLEVRPQNLPDDVDNFLKLMKWDDKADVIFTMHASADHVMLPAHWPQDTTLRELFTIFLDIFSVPRRSFFEWLSYFTKSETETEKLREFCSAEGQDDMYDYANRPRRTIYEVLTEFKSAEIPLEYITDLFPEIRPRQFSIASSRLTNSRRVELLVAIVKYQTMLRAPRKGVATSWLAGLQPGAMISVGFVAGGMRLPEKSTTPLIFVGPGTGIAPFRSFIQERIAMHPQAKDVLVFFGCRSSGKDYYFQSEWKALQEQQHLQIVLAASRDQDRKIYVQHCIQDEAQLVWQYLGMKNGVVYVSGSAGQMPTAVQKALKAIFRAEGGMSESQADEYFNAMEVEGRYQEETWS